MDRNHAIPANGRASSFPVLRRARSQGHIPDQHCSARQHDCHLEYAQGEGIETSVSVFSIQLDGNLE